MSRRSIRKALLLLLVLGLLLQAGLWLYGWMQLHMAVTLFERELGSEEPGSSPGARDFLPVARRIHLGLESSELWEILSVPPRSLSESRVLELESVVAANHEVLAQLGNAGFTAQAASLAEDLKAGMTAGRLLQVEAALGVHRREWDEAVEAAVALGSLAASLQNSESFGDVIAGNFVERLYLDVVSRFLEADLSDEVALERLRGTLVSRSPREIAGRVFAAMGRALDAFWDFDDKSDVDELLSRQITSIDFLTPVIAIINSNHTVVINGGEWHREGDKYVWDEITYHDPDPDEGPDISVLPNDWIHRLFCPDHAISCDQIISFNASKSWASNLSTYGPDIRVRGGGSIQPDNQN